jgi:hypothetical protein
MWAGARLINEQRQQELKDSMSSDAYAQHVAESEQKLKEYRQTGPHGIFALDIVVFKLRACEPQ